MTPPPASIPRVRAFAQPRAEVISNGEARSLRSCDVKVCRWSSRSSTSCQFPICACGGACWGSSSEKPPVLPTTTAAEVPLAREAVGPNLLDDEPYEFTLASLWDPRWDIPGWSKDVKLESDRRCDWPGFWADWSKGSRPCRWEDRICEWKEAMLLNREMSHGSKDGKKSREILLFTHGDACNLP